MRLRQEYFLSASAVGELVEGYVKRHGKDFSRFGELYAIQLNDTHPVLAVAEFLRILTEEYFVPFGRAVGIAQSVFHYTNHTILPEALECWPKKYIEKLLPDIYDILLRLAAKQYRDMKKGGVPK